MVISFKKKIKNIGIFKIIIKTINKFMNLLIINQARHVFCKNFSTNTV